MEIKQVLQIGAVLGLCAGVAIAFLPPVMDGPLPELQYGMSDLTDKHVRLRVALSGAVRDWRAASRRDSVLREIGKAPAGPAAPLVLIDSTLTREIGQLAVHSIDLRWEKLAIDSPKISTAVVVLRDQFSDKDHYRVPQSIYPGVEFIVPVAGKAGGVCVSVLNLREASDDRKQALSFMRGAEYGEREAFGPCAFYAALGTPGRQIAQWLEARGYQFAMSSDWNRGSLERVRRQFRGLSRGIDIGLLGSTSDLSGISLAERNCWLGDFSSCEQLVVEPNSSKPKARVVQGVYSVNDSRELVRDSRFTNAYEELLADMHRDIGAEKFARFWTSNEEPAVAFRNATGESLGRWTHRWVLDLYGPTVAGAKLPGSYFGLGLVFAIGCVSVAAVVATRRTAG